MSKTDKTRPWWVQLRDPQLSYRVKAVHRHIGAHFREHGCDLSWPLPHTRQKGWGGCEWWTPCRDGGKLYGRTRWRRRYPNRHGETRAALRQLRADWRKTAAADREDIDSTVSLPTDHWVWRGWYWD